MNGRQRLNAKIWFVFAVASSLAACKTAESPAVSSAGDAALPAATIGGGLENTRWNLIEIQSSDKAIGAKRPAQPTQYTMMLGADGKVAMKLDCNHGMGGWKAEATGSAHGKITFTPLATTRALCPQGSLDTQIARNMENVRSYTIGGNRLLLSTAVEGDNYVWEKNIE